MALASRERVPNRIARGELEGKMRCRIWKKLQPEKAKRFEAAWKLVDSHPGLDISDAFGVVQSGMTVHEFHNRRQKTTNFESIRVARKATPGDKIDGFVNAFVKDSTDVALVLGDKTVVDVMTSVEPLAFQVAKSGQIDKLQVVLLMAKQGWEAVEPTLERDPTLAKRPTPAAREPGRRPVNDPRRFSNYVGRAIRVDLRNGLKLGGTVRAIGPYDIILETSGGDALVPFHAMLFWHPADATT